MTTSWQLTQKPDPPSGRDPPTAFFSTLLNLPNGRLSQPKPRIHAGVERKSSLSSSTFSIALARAYPYDNIMDDLSQKWAVQARYDLDTADAMFNAGRYLYVLFCCQQAVEKMLKSAIVQRTNKLPPRIHQLVRLTEVGGVVVDERQVDFLRELSAYSLPGGSGGSCP